MGWSKMTELPFLRNSERAAFKTCPAKHNWGWNQGLTLKMPTKSAAWFGSIVHVALAEWYSPAGGKNGFARGRDPRETLAEQFKNEYTTISAGPYFDEVAEKEYWDAAELGKIMMTAYLAEYGTDDSWEVLMPETRFNVRIPYNKRQIAAMHGTILPSYFFSGNDKYITRLVGTFDMPIRDHVDGHVKVVDHKTTNKKESIAWLEKDDQTGTYVAVSTGYLRKAGFISDKEAVVGAVWNYLRKGKPDTRPTDDIGRALNKDGSVSKQQPNPLFWRIDLRRNKANRLRQLSRIADDAELINLVKKGALPVLKNPDEHCAWCEFKELCAVDEDGGDTEQFIKDVFKVQDMYADHRPNAENSKLVNK
jgi:PD-(D/E)XK nuclease superfamily